MDWTNWYLSFLVFLVQIVVSSSGQVKPSQPTLPETNSSSGSSRGFCTRYTGAGCQATLNETLTQFNESERYFDNKYGINRTEGFVNLLLNHIRNLKSDARCKRLLEVTFCQYTLPACQSDGKPISFCREDCEELLEQCGIYLHQLIGAVYFWTSQTDIDFFHLIVPRNCSSYNSRKFKGSCVDIGLFDHSMSASSAPNNIILWSSVGAISFVIIIAITIIVSLKCRQSKVKREAIGLDELKMVTWNLKAKALQLLQNPELSSKVAETYDPNNLKQISLDDIEYVSDLGEGQFGLVFQGIAKGLDGSKKPSHQTPVAVKTLKKSSNKDEFYQEVAFMSFLNHPNIVKLMGVATEDDPYCMIFEFMDLGDLNQFLRKAKPLDGTEQPQDQLSLDDFLNICNQVASGMLYLSSLRFVHRDLATRNCLVGEGLKVKIADFGMSRDIYSSDYYKVRGDATLPVRWMPPEALLHGRFTVDSDIYSYGVLMWEVFTHGLQPFYGYTNAEVVAFAKQGVLLGQPDDCPMHLYNLMCECWRRNPQERPAFDVIMKRLVRNPAQCINNRIKNLSIGHSRRATLEKVVDPTTSAQITGTYHTPESIINSGFVPDNQNAVIESTNQSQGSNDINGDDQSIS